MALTLGRWIALAFILFAAVAVSALPLQRSTEWRYYSRISADPAARASRIRNGFEADLYNATRLLWVWQRRDSVLATLQAYSSEDEDISVLQDPNVPDWVGARVRAIIENEIIPYRRPHSGRTLVAILADTTQVTRATQLLPNQTDGRTCLVLFNVGRQWVSAESAEVMTTWQLRIFDESILGPCALVQAVGVPSEPIVDWLSRTFRIYASDAKATPTDVSMVDRDRFRRYRGVLNSYSGPALSCIKRGSDCDLFHDRGVTSAQGASSNPAWERQYYEIVSGIRSYRAPWDQRFAFGGYEHRLLYDMALDLGADRFAAFWQSPLEASAAFEAATGAHPESWIAQWADRFGPAPRQMPPLRASSLLASVAIVGVFFGLGAVVASRRQVN